MRRRRKMVKLRRMTLTRKTDPKTGKHTVCEPAKSTCKQTFHKRHFVPNLTRKMPLAYIPRHGFRANMSQEAFCAIQTKENAAH